MTTAIGMFDPEDFKPDYGAPGDADRETAISAIRTLDKRWKEPSGAITIGELRWLPDLADSDGRVLHLALSGDIPNALMRRLRAARDAGYDVTVGLGSHQVEIPTLVVLQELDARIISVDWDAEPGITREYRSVADWIATERIALEPSDLRRLAIPRLEESLTETASRKGRLFEEFLCLLFSQISWVTVDEHAYRNASEEIDLVLGIHAVGQVAGLAKGAIALATAKNESKATDSATVKYLKEQMANRKGRCNLGFLCSASSISDPAKTEILRGSQSSDLVIVPLDLTDLRVLVEDAEHLDQRIQGLVQKAVAD